jgi:hypothetical protein
MEWESNHSLVPGDICYLNASGQLETVTATNNAVISSATSSKFVGRSLGYASPGDSALVIVANENTLFELPIWDPTPANAVLKRDHLQNDFAGVSTADAAGGRVHAVNVGNTTNPILRPLVFVRHSGHAIPGYTVPWSSTGEQYGRVGAIIISSARRLS